MISPEKAESHANAGPLLGDAGRGDAPRSPARVVTGHIGAFLTWAWAIVVLVALLLIRWVGDRWWGVTVLLFFPRWLFLAPLPVLALAAAFARRPGHWLLQGVVALVVAGPLMGLSLPVHQLGARVPEGAHFRVMTYNRGLDSLDGDRLARFIEREQIDLICFQEGDIFRDHALEAYLASSGWHRDRRGTLASRHPIVAELPPIPF